MSKSPQANIIERLSFKIGPAFRRAFGELERMQTNKKGSEASKAYANEAAQEIKEFITERLLETEKPVFSNNPELSELPEEGACWLIEPVCGFTNFMHARKPVCSLFIYMKDRKPTFAAVYYALTDELFFAEYGNGARGPIKLRFSGREDLGETLMAFAPSAFNDPVSRKLLSDIQDAGIAIRHSGSVVSDIVDVASGQADAIVATEMSLACLALANLMVKESGGYATDFSGNKLSLNSISMVAANLELHSKVLKVLV